MLWRTGPILLYREVSGVPGDFLGFPRLPKSVSCWLKFHPAYTLVRSLNCLQIDERRARVDTVANFDEKRRAVGKVAEGENSYDLGDCK